MRTREQINAYARAWRAANPDQSKSYSRKYYRANREKVLAHAAAYDSWHGPIRRAQRKVKWAELRQLIIDKYGGCCIACGETELAVLCLDHVNDDGHAERANRSSGWAHQYKLAGEPRRADLQCMCHNCNWRKRVYGPDISTWIQQC